MYIHVISNSVSMKYRLTVHFPAQESRVLRNPEIRLRVVVEKKLSYFGDNMLGVIFISESDYPAVGHSFHHQCSNVIPPWLFGAMVSIGVQWSGGDGRRKTIAFCTFTTSLFSLL